MSVLVDIFDTLDLQGVMYFQTNFSPPWAIEVPPLGQATRFHLIMQGRCRFKFPSGQSVAANAGDMILIPGGRSHIMSCEPISSAPSVEEVMAKSGYTGSGVFVVGSGETETATQILCGHFDFHNEADHPIINALPEYMTVRRSDRAQNLFLNETMNMIVKSVRSGTLGVEPTFRRLSEIIFIEIICSAANSDQALGSVLQAFTDIHIGRALDLVHKNIAANWSVGGLASEVGMSRSRFAQRFKDLMGIGPMTYVSEWRLQKAVFLLRQTPATVQTVANKIGYQSPAAFTRAFTQKFGQSPSLYRKNQT